MRGRWTTHSCRCPFRPELAATAEALAGQKKKAELDTASCGEGLWPMEVQWRRSKTPEDRPDGIQLCSH